MSASVFSLSSFSVSYQLISQAVFSRLAVFCPDIESSQEVRMHHLLTLHAFRTQCQVTSFSRLLQRRQREIDTRNRFFLICFPPLFAVFYVWSTVIGKRTTMTVKQYPWKLHTNNNILRVKGGDVSIKFQVHPQEAQNDVFK